MRINLSMESISSDSKLLICSVCCSISFSGCLFCGVGTLFSECPLWVFILFIFPCAAGAWEIDGVENFWGLDSCLVICLGLGLGYLLLCSVL